MLWNLVTGGGRVGGVSPIYTLEQYFVALPRMAVTSILVKCGLKNVSHTLAHSATSNDNDHSCLSSKLISDSNFTANGSPQGRKVGPPPLKSGSQYINPGDEDQMVRSFTLMLHET